MVNYCTLVVFQEPSEYMPSDVADLEPEDKAQRTHLWALAINLIHASTVIVGTILLKLDRIQKHR